MYKNSQNLPEIENSNLYDLILKLEKRVSELEKNNQKISETDSTISSYWNSTLPAKNYEL